jgi:outer membrane protein assembly factor BamD
MLFLPFFSLILGSLLCLSGCATKDPVSLDQATLFKNAQKSIKKAYFSAAISDLESMESLYPFGPYAEKVQLALIYSYFKNEAFPEALAQADRFIRLYPLHAHLDYVYFMKGMAHFEASHGGLIRYLPMDLTTRDKKEALLAYQDFSLLTQRFPKSIYTQNVYQKRIFLRNRLAQHEYNVADYYFQRHAPLAAAQRAQVVLQEYAQSPSAIPAKALWEKATQALHFKGKLPCPTC